MKKIILATVALLMLMALFSSCAKKPEEQPPEPTDWISLSEIASYKIVLPKHANTTLKNYANTLKGHIVAATGIADMQIVEQSEGGKNEILFGDTNTQASNAFLADFRYDDFGYSANDKTIVIAGYSTEALKNSINKFKTDVLDKIDTASGIFMKYESAVVNGSYKNENMTVGGIAAKGLKVVYSADANEATVSNAVSLAKSISKKTGYGVVARSSEEYTDSDNILYYGAKEDFGPKEAVRGLSLPEALGEKDIYIARNANTIVYAFDNSNREAAYTKLGELISNITDNDISLPAKKIYSYVGIMSYNIYVGNQAKPEYIARVIDIIDLYMPDSFGVQEATQAWVNNIANAFSQYAWVGEPRGGGGSNEYSAIFYLKDKYTLVESGTKWLTDTPNVPSKVEASSLNRIMTYAVLRDKNSGNEYLHVNTHLDHTSDEARIEQSEYLLQIIDDLGRYEMPIFITGDFNCVKGSDPYLSLLDWKYLDSASVANQATTAGTFHGYSGHNSIIDFCFVNSKVDVLTYEVYTGKVNGDYASDHHPVFIEAYY